MSGLIGNRLAAASIVSSGPLVAALVGAGVGDAPTAVGAAVGEAPTAVGAWVGDALTLPEGEIVGTGDPVAAVAGVDAGALGTFGTPVPPLPPEQAEDRMPASSSDATAN